MGGSRVPPLPEHTHRRNGGAGPKLSGPPTGADRQPRAPQHPHPSPAGGRDHHPHGPVPTWRSLPVPSCSGGRLTSSALDPGWGLPPGALPASSTSSRGQSKPGASRRVPRMAGEMAPAYPCLPGTCAPFPHLPFTLTRSAEPTEQAQAGQSCHSWGRRPMAGVGGPKKDRELTGLAWGPESPWEYQGAWQPSGTSPGRGWPERRSRAWGLNATSRRGFKKRQAEAGRRRGGPAAWTRRAGHTQAEQRTTQGPQRTPASLTPEGPSPENWGPVPRAHPVQGWEGQFVESGSRILPRAWVMAEPRESLGCLVCPT